MRQKKYDFVYLRKGPEVLRNRLVGVKAAKCLDIRDVMWPGPVEWHVPRTDNRNIFPYFFGLLCINSYCQRLADIATTKKIWAWLFLCLVGLAWCLRWGMCKNWAHDALVLGLRAQESTKTAYLLRALSAVAAYLKTVYLLRALSAVAAYRFFSNLVIQSCLTYILCQ